MTRYLLDTNIISNVTKPMPSRALIGWMAIDNERDFAGIKIINPLRRAT